jgi:ABC-2 type transport system permease protein
MRNSLTVAVKEFRTYFRTPIAFIYLSFFLMVMGYLFFWMGAVPFFKRGIVEMRGFFDPLPIVFLFFIPAISMRMWSEEKKLGTLEILLTLPLREWEVVAGKFLAGLGLLGVSLVLTFPIPVILSLIGDPDFGPIWGGYLGTLFLGAAYLAIGLFASSLTENQIVAFILAVVMCFVFYIMGVFTMQGILPAFLERYLTYMSLLYHFQSIQRGVLDSRDIIYYVSIILFFLFLNVYVIRHRR